MKTKIIFAPVLLFMLICSSEVYSQENGLDSLQKKILESVQKSLDKNGVHKYKGYDTSDIFNGKSPVDLKKIFEDVSKKISLAKSTGDVSRLRAGYYKLSSLDSMRGNYKGAYENYKLYTLYRDSLQKKEMEKNELQVKMQREFDKKQAQLKLEKIKEDRANSIKLIFLSAFLLAFITISTSSFIAYKREQKAKKLVHSQKAELEITLSELKLAQQQLIQSEKMASLGELTAGIAHEIQNPLNFVNNFSEVNRDLINELVDEVDKRNTDEVKNIANDIKENEEKINHHGKRADAIVKGMLQHSRSSTGVKEVTDINKLADEYLRLAYSGFRAKDKEFNAELKTDFDAGLSVGEAGIGKINIVPQDIGRVLLNLYNNAFYAVNEKKKSEDAGYEPAISVSTKKSGDKVEIRVKDNGNGIPQKAIDKIFQPFFITKPTGQGTGLGLSLSYDIVKAHGGEIKVETKEGKGSEFMIQLPLNIAP